MNENEKFPSEEWVEQLQEEIDRLVENGLTKATQVDKPEVIYESIEDYETKTGKRFRMKKAEMQEGLSREEAFRKRFE